MSFHRRSKAFVANRIPGETDRVGDVGTARIHDAENALGNPDHEILDRCPARCGGTVLNDKEFAVRFESEIQVECVGKHIDEGFPR